ncbi:MAG: cadherin domain-containing protein, partial [Thermosynechococcaceae cyanobacterium]
MDDGTLFGTSILGGRGILQGGLLENASLEDNGFLGLSDLLKAMGRRTSGAIDVPELSPFYADGPATSSNRPDLPNPDSGIQPNFSPLNQAAPSDPITGSTETPLVGGPQFRSDVTMNPAFAIKAEGQITINGRGDFDGEALNPADDALIYGGGGVRINGLPTLAVQRRADGSVIKDARGRDIVVDNAVAVGSASAVFQAPTHAYGGLDTRKVVEGISVEIPDFSSIVTEQLAAKIPTGTPTIRFNANQVPLYSATVWNRNFPGGGTATNPSVIEVQSNGLNIPSGVNLQNTVIILNQGTINFNGSNHQLNNVTLMTRNGGVNLNNVQANNLTVLSSGSINMNSGARFGGNSLIATGSNRSVIFNGATSTTDASSHLTVISQRDISFNGNLDTRGTFQAARNVTLNGRSSVIGSIVAEGDIRFNGEATVIAEVSNQSPTDIVLSTRQIAENGAENALVGNLSTVDATPGDSHTYQLVTGAGDLDNSRFEIVGNQLRILESANFESQDSYSVRVRSTDAAGASAAKALTIAVLNVNEAPTQILLSQTTVAENSGSGTVIGRLSTVDPDVGDSHSYRLVNDGDRRFRIVGSNLEVAPDANLDFEGISSFAIEVESTDAAGLKRTQQFVIGVTDVNEAPLAVVLSNAVVNEDAAIDTVVGTLTTLDPDAADSHFYSLIDDAAGAFKLVGNQLQVAGELNFEDSSSYTVTVRTTDSGNPGLVYDQVLTISVGDVNEAPGAIALSNAAVDENAVVGSVIGTLSTTDPDAVDSHVYTLLDDAGGRFQIIDGQLQVAGDLDFEAQAIHTIAVRSTDSQGLSVVREFAVELTDINEAPRNLVLDNSSVDENVAGGTAVGTLSVTDPDAGDLQTFSLVAGDGDADNAAFTIVGNQLQIQDSPNFEGQSSYQIRLRSTDAGGLTVERMFSVSIRDINEAPTQVALDGNGVLENASAGTVVGTLSSLDPDLGDSHTYALVDDAGGRFAIVDGQLQVATGAEFDYETNTRHQVTVSSTDAGGLTVEETFMVYVMDVTEGIAVTAALQLDTGAEGTDRITSDATIVGSIAGAQNIARLWAGFGEAAADQYIDVRALVQADGSFTLTETALAQIFGGALPDGEHALHLQAIDRLGETSEFFDVNFTLDRANPLLNLVTPLVDGQHSANARLLGTVTDDTSAVQSVTASIDGVSQSLAFDGAGKLDTALSNGLADGAHQLVVTVVDVAGNQTATEIDFRVANDAIVLGPNGSVGWGAKSATAVVLGEGNSLVTEASVAVDLGQDAGSRTLTFDVNALFDRTDVGAGDRLLVYLVDANDPAVTLLGQTDAPVFTLSESGAEYQAGLVRYDGAEVEIDVTSLRDETQGLLVFQLINQDGDAGSLIAVSSINSEVDAAGIESPVFPNREDVVQPGGALELGNLNPSDAVEVIWSNVRLDTSTGEYRANLQLRNTGAAIGRQMAVVFDNLPDGVTLENASGSEVDGDPYVNFRGAIRPGGLAA